MSYQQATNSAIGSIARLFAVSKGFSEASKIRGAAERTEQKVESLQLKDIGGTYTFTPQKIPEEILQFRKMQEANDRAARKQELRRTQKENMAYFAGKFWKEQK